MNTAGSRFVKEFSRISASPSGPGSSMRFPMGFWSPKKKRGRFVDYPYARRRYLL
jgi:hypothetical protein